MAKAIAKASGDKVKAEVLYLEWRVELLKEEAVNELKRQKADAKRRETEKREKRKADEELEKGDRLNKGCAVFFFVIGVVAIVYNILIHKIFNFCIILNVLQFPPFSLYIITDSNVIPSNISY